MADVKNIKVDRMRYTKNKLSSTLAYVAIIFNVLYFVSIYSSNIGNYYYNMSMGLSVLCNLVFLLAAFLCSEGIKNYNIGYAYFLIILSVVQVARIFGIPKRAHGTIITLVEEEVKVTIIATGFDKTNFETFAEEKPKKAEQPVRPLIGHERLDNLFANAMEKEEQSKTDYQARPQPQQTFVQPKQNDPFATRIQPREDDDIPPFLRKLRK